MQHFFKKYFKFCFNCETNKVKSSNERGFVMNDISFGKYLESLRNQKKYSQRKLALLAGLSNTTVNRLELNQNTPDLETVIKLSNALKCPLEDLLKHTDIEDNIYKVKADELPDRLKELGVEYYAVNKEAKDKGVTPEELRKMIKAILALRSD